MTVHEGSGSSSKQALPTPRSPRNQERRTVREAATSSISGREGVQPASAPVHGSSWGTS